MGYQCHSTHLSKHHRTHPRSRNTTHHGHPLPCPLHPFLASFKIHRFEVLDSHFHYNASNHHRPLSKAPVTDFFGSVSAVQPTPTLDNTAGDLHNSSSNSSLGDLQQPQKQPAAAYVDTSMGTAAAAAAATSRAPSAPHLPLLQFPTNGAMTAAAEAAAAAS
jgi:hypothetical protein